MMVLKKIERLDVDTNKWDALVASKEGASSFSLSSYLDAVAENWCVITDENYTCGIAVPYTVRLGVKCFTTPIFVRYLEWFGAHQNWEMAVTLINKHFSGGDLQVPKLLKTDSRTRYYQSIIGERLISTQAKRMLTKSKHLIVESGSDLDIQAVLEIISTELPGKIATLNKGNIETLKGLVANMTQLGLVKSFVIKNQNTTVAGLILIQFNGVLLYLKGASFEEFKKVGAMYALMNCAIEYARENNLLFDFGGSSAEGVRRFNLNLGGEDNEYGFLISENIPFWFKKLKRIKNLWTKK